MRESENRFSHRFKYSNKQQLKVFHLKCNSISNHDLVLTKTIMSKDWCLFVQSYACQYETSKEKNTHSHHMPFIPCSPTLTRLVCVFFSVKSINYSQSWNEKTTFYLVNIISILYFIHANCSYTYINIRWSCL